MPQPWYGQHGPAATAGQHSKASGLGMHHHGYHHGQPLATGIGYVSHRSSPTMSRPPSSASTSSNNSYHVVTGPVPPVQGHNSASKHHSQGHPMPMVNGPYPPTGHSGHQAGMHHHMPAARYPMPPRNGGNMPHGSHLPMRSHQSIPPPGHNQPLRQLSGGNAPAIRETHNGPPPNELSHYAPVKAPSSMARPAGTPQMHHPVPYRRLPHRIQGVAGQGHTEHYQHHQYHHQGYNQHLNAARRSSYPPVQHLYGIEAQHHHEAKYAHYQRPMYESPETVVDNASMSRSPSPPPAPPSSAQRKPSGIFNPADQALPTSSMGLAERKLSGDAPNLDSARNIAANTQQNGPPTQENSKPDSTEPKTSAKKNEDDDAASILLQLSGVPSQSSGQETASATGENPPVATVQARNSGSFASHPTAGLQASSSMEDDATIATVEGTDCAPDLTSEPSSDSTENNESDFPAPIPENYPTRLALKYDDTKLNSLHCFLRSELLEIFVVQKSAHKSPTHSPGSSVGRVGLRCVHCAMTQRQKENRDEAPMAVFYPKSIAEIYRLVTSWQRCHLRKCRNLPPSVRAKWQSLRDNDKSRGKTHYWITSAKEIGLMDCQSRAGGVRFGPNTKGNEGAKEVTQVPSTATEVGTSSVNKVEALEANTSSMLSETQALESQAVDATETSASG